MSTGGLPLPMLLGALACALAVLATVWAVLAPRRTRLALARRRPGAAPPPGVLSTAATRATTLVEGPMARGDRMRSSAATLERAGVKLRPQDLTVLVLVATGVTFVAGTALAGPLLGLLLGLAVPLLTKVALGMLAGRRQRAFADQLEDSLQLMASSLRAGHSLLQALNSVAGEAEEPTSEEFARIVNETRVGRDLGTALAETGRRTASQDFDWVAQAIAINREVGGNLAEVLDGVAETIRERNQIRRQVQALSAEGKLSAYVLMALPFGIVAFLAVTTPSYVAAFTESLAGYTMIGAAVVLLVLGALWLRKVVSFRF